MAALRSETCNADVERDPTFKAFVTRERDCLSRLARELDDLHALTHAPVTARRPWLQTWLDSYTAYEPLLVGVRRDDRLEAAAPLALLPRRTHIRVVAMGHGPSDEARIPARDAQAADALGRAVAAALRGLGSRHSVELRHLCRDEPSLGTIAAHLQHAAIEPGDVSPRLTVGRDRTLRSYVSRNHHQQRRRLLNRITNAGLRLDLQQRSTPEEIAQILPDVRALCRERDVAIRGHSRLDEPAYSHFFDEVTARHAALAAVNLTTLSLDGDLAAYVLCFRDGPTWRMWHARVRPRWLEYGPGRLATDAAVEAALSDPACVEFDWMRGGEPYKYSLSDHTYRSVDLFASSSTTAWWFASTSRDARRRARDFKNEHERLADGWQHIQPKLRRFGRTA